MKFPNGNRLVSGIAIFLLLSVLFTPVAAALDPPAATALQGPSDPAEVEAFLDYTIPANLARYNIPGATIAVVKDGELVLAKGYGYSNLMNKTSMNADQTIVHIGSTTKLFTWTTVMQLVAEGKIDLDADVNTYLKDFRIPDTYPGRPVTMRHLMTHTAGFEDEARHSTVLDKKDLISYRKYCANNIPTRVFPSGMVSSYSNYGTTLAGVIVEDVSGMPFDDYLQSRILSPLGMSQTSIRVVLPPERLYNLSQGYVYDGNENAYVPDDIWVIGPAGTISSTAPDMARFLAAHMQDGTYRGVTILPADTARLMHARAFANDPRVSGMCLGFYEMQINNRRLIGHGGDTLTFHSLLVIIPEEQAGFFVSFNSIGGKKARNELLTEFMDHYYPADTTVTPQPDPSAASRVQQYAGTYESNRHNYARFEKYFAPWAKIEITATPDGTLLMPEGSQTVELVESETGVFSRVDGTHPANGDIVFHTRADGTVDFYSMENVPFLVFDRVPWYATAGFTDNLKTAAEIILATVLLWPLLFVFRRAYSIPEPSVPKPAGIARWVAGCAAFLILAFTIVLLPWVMENEILVSYAYYPAIPPLLTAALTVPVIAALLTLVTVAFTIIAWKEQYWTRLHRVHYTLITAALVAMLWWVNFWNLWVFSL